MVVSGYLCPFSYITTYTIDIVIPRMDPASVGPLTSAWPLFSCNIGMFFGRIMVGHAADRIGSIQCMVIALEIAGVLQIVAWHYATSFAGIIAFAVVYGMLGGATLSLIAPVIAQIFGVRKNMASLVGLAMVASAPGRLYNHVSANELSIADDSFRSFSIW